MQRLSVPARVRLWSAVAVLVVAGAARLAVAPPQGYAVAGGLTVLGVGAVAAYTATLRRPDHLAFCKRCWVVAVALVVPYGLAVAPSSPEAAAVGALLSGPPTLVLGSAVWAAELTAAAATVYYGFAFAGEHGRARSPEERVLGEDFDT